MEKKRKIEDVYPLTPLQQGMYFHALYNKDSSAYFMQMSYRVAGEWDHESMERGFSELVKRHDILRTVFVHKNVDAPLQIVLQRQPAGFCFIDMRKGVADGDGEAIVADFKKQDRERSFDLGKGPLLRLSVLRLRDFQYEFIWSNHHILMDGWCAAVLIAEFMQIYQLLRSGSLLRLPPPIPFKRYIKWLESRRLDDSRDHWQTVLSGYEGLTGLPADWKWMAGDEGAFVPCEYSIELPEQCYRHMQTVVGRYHVTANSILQAAWGVLLGKYNHTRDVVFGAVESVRPDSIGGIERMLGLFINTVPVRVRYLRDMTVERLLSLTQETAIAGKPHNHLPLAQIQSEFLQQSSLLDHILVFENYPVDQDIDRYLSGKPTDSDSGADYRVEAIDLFSHTNYDFSIVAVPSRSLTLTFKYNGRVYSEAVIRMAAGHLLNLLERMMEDPTGAVGELDILSANERRAVLSGCNDNEAGAPPPAEGIFSQFLQQADRFPHQIALVYRDCRMSYSWLADCSLRLARRLRGYGVGEDVVTGILAEPSMNMIVSLLGILAAGGAFLPMDGRFPTSRVEALLSDCGAPVLLSDGANRNPSGFRGELIDISSPGCFENFDAATAPSGGGGQLAYVISTSGTTGKPKGVMITHANLLNYVSWFSKTADISNNDRSALLSSYAYDLGYTSLFTTLLRGGQLHVLDNDSILSPRFVLWYIGRRGISFLKMTPSLLSVLVAEPEFHSVSLTGLRVLALGGEEIKPHDVALFHQKAPGVKVMNHYGPAESCIGVVAQWIDFQQFERYMKKSTIGKPVTNTAAWVLDLDKHHVPVGVAGELYVSGAGLGRGYLNAPELTAERFVPEAGNGGRRLYKTGDLARRLEDGSIEFLGRVDRQLKIRGFRVECGEIEHVLKGHTGISAAVVVPRRNSKGETILCAYFVGESTVGEAIRGYLRKRLPDYMVPSYFCPLDNIPMTKNRKLDHEALPDPMEFAQIGADAEAPLEGTEQALAEIWRDVLAMEHPGPQDSFFQCGGHSLNAISLASRIQQEFQKEISLKDIFANPVLRHMANLIDGTGDAGESVFPKAGKKDFFSASSAQRRIFMLDQWDGIGTSYHISQFFRIEGDLDVERVKGIFKDIVDRHDSLRTSFRVEETIVREVRSQVPLLFDFYEGRDIHSLVKRFIRPFDLSEAPLVRFGVAKLGRHSFVLMVDMHHIISDGISNSIIIEEFMQYYHGRDVSPLDYSYRDFVYWQHQRLYNGEFDSQRRFWLDSLRGELPASILPLDFPRSAVQSFSGATLKKKLSRPLVRRLRQLAAHKNASLFMVMLAAYTILLGRTGNQEDVLVGTVVAGRPHRCFEGVVGLFANTLALRYSPLGSQTVSQFLDITRQKTLDAFAHQDYPFEELIDHLGVEGDWGRNPLFGTLFVNQNMEREQLRLPGLDIYPLELENRTSKFDLSVFVIEHEDDVECHLEYCSDLFLHRTIERLWSHYTQLLAGIPEQQPCRLGDLDLMDRRERELVIRQFNDSAAEFPAHATVHGLFSQMARQRKDGMAIVFRDCQVTYRELDARSGKLAGMLKESGARPGNIVGLLVKRGAAAIVGILGIFKSGQAYLPIDPSFPVRRKKVMLRDSTARVILTEAGLLEQGKALVDSEHALRLYSLDDEGVYAGKGGVAVDGLTSRDPAYVIYTSGSTGFPKGVMVEHRSVVRLVINTNFFSIHPGDRFLQSVPLVFDVSVFEIWGPLLNGLVFCVIPKSSILSPVELKEAIVRYRITTMWLTTPVFNQHMNADPSAFATLHTLVIGGDALSVPHVNRLVALFPELRVVNGYGPTENGILSSWYTIEGTHTGSVPIGKPVANSTCYVLNSFRRPQGIGVIGELCTGGFGVARGYINEPLLTSRKYFESPDLPGERLYATGDVVRWKEEGILEYLGRKDQQVKVRGNRVEIGEIEEHILKIGAVKDVVVAIRSRENDNKELVAYLVAGDHEAKIDCEELADRLSESLPEFMVPTFFVQVPEIPLNANGKVDLGRLPEPIHEARESKTPPQNEWEKKLARLWVDILDLRDEEPDIDGNFFRIGGHSLKATLLVAKIHKVFELKISTIDIFRRPTIRLLARHLKQSSRHEFKAINPVEGREWYPLSSAQNRIHVLHQVNKHNTAYNIPSVFRATGPVSRKKLMDAFRNLIERHHVLRTSFPVVKGKPVQVVHPAADVELEEAVLDSSVPSRTPEAVIHRFIRPFDLLTAPLLRICLASWDKKNHLLLVDMHHIVCDGMSYRLFVGDLVSLYEGKALTFLPIQYKDYASWQSLRLAEGGLDRQADYWFGTFADGVPPLSFPSDYTRPPVQDYEGEQIRFDIQGPLLNSLKQVSSKTGATLNIVLLSAFTILLSRYSGRDDLVVGMPTAGRTHADLEPLIGMFVNMLPIRCRPLESKRFDHYLMEVAQKVLEAFENQDYPFDELVDRVGMQRDVGRFPLFDVSFQLGHLDAGVSHQYSFSDSAGELRVEPYEGYRNQRTKLDLVLEGIDEGHCLRMVQQYATALFSPATVQRMTRRYMAILRQIAGRLDIPLNEIEIDHELGMADGAPDGAEASDFNFPIDQ
jgi:amino acid adenylation domain-containing protein